MAEVMHALLPERHSAADDIRAGEGQIECSVPYHGCHGWYLRRNSRKINFPARRVTQWYGTERYIGIYCASARHHSASAVFLRPRFFIVPALASAMAKMMALSSGWPMPGMER